MPKFGRCASRCLLLSALLLLSSSVYSEPLAYDGPELPEGWWPISETQLTALEQELTLQADLSMQLRTQLQVASQQLSAAQKLLTSSTLQLDAASLSLTTLEGKVNVLVWQRNIAIGATLLAGVLAVCAFIW